MKTAVAFVIFNRPEVTARIFAAIQAARPAKLLVVADGARAGKEGEAERCAAARGVVERGVDWPCEVLWNVSGENLGCGRRVSSGLSWVFERVERAIVLEDDCLPEGSFFGYCEELLERYAGDERVMHIGGTNFQCGKKRGEKGASYFFSKYVHVWGWASWRRAWAKYDFGMRGLERWIADGGLERAFGDRLERDYFRKVFERTKAGGIDTWDYQWAFACLRNGGLAAHPNVNLVRNLGFGAEATHTTGGSPLMNLATEGIGKLVHPREVAVDAAAERHTFDFAFGGAGMRGSLAGRLKGKLRAAYKLARSGTGIHHEGTKFTKGHEEV